jgi:hypothetical protein
VAVAVVSQNALLREICPLTLSKVARMHFTLPVSRVIVAIRYGSRTDAVFSFGSDLGSAKKPTAVAEASAMIAAANTMIAACRRPCLTGIPRVLRRPTGCGLPDVLTPRFNIPFPAKNADRRAEARNFCCMPIMKLQF